jgi:hypothetical protein
LLIDDPKAAFKEQYLNEEKSPVSLAVFGTKLAFPKAGFLLDIFSRVNDHFQKPSVNERIAAMFQLLVQETEHLESTKVDADDLQEAIQLAIRHDAEEFNDRKRERYVRLIGNALRSEARIQDVTTFIQTIEQLSERDVIVLKVLNKIMNKEGDWKGQVNSSVGTIMKLHPSTLIGRAQELSVQIALALGQKTETNMYSREEGYGICNRLQGFGLAHELEQTRELPLTNYSFRLSTQGIRLLKLLGEDVPNFDHYFRH